MWISFWGAGQWDWHGYADKMEMRAGYK